MTCHHAMQSVKVRASDDGWFSPVGADGFDPLLYGLDRVHGTVPVPVPGEALESQAKRRGTKGSAKFPKRLPCGVVDSTRPCIKFLMSRVLMPDPFQAQHVAS